MHNPAIPMRLTCTQPYDPPEPGDTMQLGLPMGKRMERYLQSALQGWTLEERVAQLEQLDERCASAWKIYAEKKDITAVISRLRVSERTAYRLVATARRVLLISIDPRDLSQEDRWKVLQICDPEAFAVLTAMDFGWRQSGIAAHLTALECSKDPRAGETCAGENCGHRVLTVDQVRTLANRGRKIIDGPPEYAARLYARAVSRGLNGSAAA